MKKRVRRNKYIKKHIKTCGRCGNSGFTKKEPFCCKYCGWPYGEEMEGYEVIITRGTLEE